VVIGCSAGCLQALGTTVLGGLSEGFPAAVCIVLHTSPDSPRVVPDMLRRQTSLPVKYADDEEPVRTGCVYIAPPDYHLLVEDGLLGLGTGPRENRHRPAVDPLFRTAAASYRNRAVGVVLTGNLDDGTRGLMAIKKAGGVAIVQDPADTMFPGMPQSALNSVSVDYVVRISELASLLVRLTEEVLPDDAEGEVVSPELPGEAFGLYTCPDCGGPLLEIGNGGQLPYYRCRVGHAYSAERMLQAQRDGVETSLWAAVVSLEQQADINRRLWQDAEREGRKHSAKRFKTQAETADQHASVVRSILTGSTEQ
jgi:two-component system chemotaxis response regulator CheB